MNKLLRVSALLTLSLTLLQGCAAPVVKPSQRAQMLADFGEGRVIMNCSILCAHQYIFRQEALYGLYQQSRWEDLAFAVMKAGWRQDITYFYLAVSAEQLGYTAAADRYYRVAGALSLGRGAATACADINNLCGPFTFPQDIVPRLVAADQAVRQMLASAPPPPPTDAAAAQSASLIGMPVVYGNSQGVRATAAVATMEFETCTRFAINGAQRGDERFACRDANGDWHVH